MKRALVRAALVASCSAAVFGIGTAGASAAFPNFTDCPTFNPNVRVCANIQSTGGFLRIKDFSVPIGNSFELRGGITDFNSGNVFVAPRGTTGIFARPIQVPGGLIGIDFPIPGNAVTATAMLAGSPSDIRVTLTTQDVSIPLKLELSNPLLGMNCKIGSNANPVRVNLTTSTTNPPPPNRPISGRFGTFTIVNGVPVLAGNVNVDNAFAIPGANSCGLGLGLINTLVNAKLKLPSAAGNNEMQVVNDVALAFV